MADMFTGDERRLADPRLLVEEAREELLSRAALAENQHRRRELGDLVHQLDDLADLLARPDVELAVALLGDLRAERHDLAIQILPLAGVPHQRAELVVVEVLRDVVIGAVLHRLHGGLDLVDGRDHDALDQAVVLLDDAQDVEPADAGQADILQHHVDFLLAEQRQCGFAARHGQDPIVASEDRRDGVPHALIVVADQDGFRGRRHETARLYQGLPRPRITDRAEITRQLATDHTDNADGDCVRSGVRTGLGPIERRVPDGRHPSSVLSVCRSVFVPSPS